MTALWQTPTWQPRDAEAVVITALKSRLIDAGQPDVYLNRRVPDTRHDRMVIVTRDGGAWNGLTDIARMRVRCFAANDEDAADLAALVIRLVLGLTADATALHVEHLSGPLDTTDTSEQPQRYLLFEIHLRGEEPQ